MALVGMSIVEQRYQAVLAVLAGDPVSPFAVDFFAYPLRSVNGAPDSAGEAPGWPE